MGETLTAMGKGAAMGAIGGPVGMALGAAGGAVMSMAPEIGRFLFGADGESVAKQVVSVVEDVTGTSDPAAQEAAIQDPDTAIKLKAALATIAAQRAAARDQADIERQKLANEDTASARKADAERTGVLRFATLYFSTAIFLLYAGVLVAGMYSFPAVPPDDMATLRTVFVAAIFYWTGSSRGSAVKDEEKRDRR